MRFEKLLDMRMKDLHVPLNESPVHSFVQQLYYELKTAGLKHFRPHVWFSDEWFTPDKVPGFAVPFYLATPRLRSLEKKMVGRVEGGTAGELMRLLRHECGHAFDNAYRLSRIEGREELFGSSKARYSNYYEPQPYSRQFVRNLGDSYAQSHPDEDFAESFAVWLNPFSEWQDRYSGRALEKLIFIDQLVAQFGSQQPKLKNKICIDDQKRNRSTLRGHYAERRRYLKLNRWEKLDSQLLKVFSQGPQHWFSSKASDFIRHQRPQLRKKLAKDFDLPLHVADRFIKTTEKRSEQLNLYTYMSKRQSSHSFNSMLSLATFDYVQNGHYKVAR